MAKRGQPTKLNDVMKARVFFLARRGCTDAQISEVLGIAEATLNNWKRQLNFLESLNKCKEVADDLVERSLFERALGFEYVDQAVVGLGDNATVVDVHKRLPPDVTAQIFWLKNRRKKHWRDRSEVEHGGEVTVNHLLEGAVRRAMNVTPEAAAPTNGHANGNGHSRS